MQEKKALKEEKLKQEEKYLWAFVNSVKERVFFSLLLLNHNHTYTLCKNDFILYVCLISCFTFFIFIFSI